MNKLVRLTAAALLWLLPHAGLSAQVWDSHYAPKDFSVAAALGFLYFGEGLSLGAYPGAELILHEFVISEEVPLEVGVAARGIFNLYRENEPWGDYGWLAFGGGGFGTAHFSFRGSDLVIPPFLESMDFYAALGLTFTYFTFTGNWGTLGKYADTGIGFACYGGVSYFLKENLAVFLEGTYWDFGGGAALGALLKL